MNDLYIKREIIAIDLKSFFASCECIERNIDGFKVPLVVCDPSRNGAITLAISPYLKSLRVKGRTRVYDLPRNIKILKVPPRMSLYMQKSKEVIDVYLEFVSREDMHIYSIDEVFLDVTDYLSFYKKSTYEIALDIINKIKEKTGLPAAAGIGPNILLAKIAMDTDGKNNKDNIGVINYDDIPNKLWPISPLSKMWGIGPRMEKKLNILGLSKIGDIANYDKNKLREKFGTLGLELWNHANGIYLTSVKNLNISPKEKSINHSQVLFKDYDDTNIDLIILEMIEVLTRRLRSMKKQTSIIGFGIGYSREINGGFSHMIKIDKFTKDSKEIYKVCMNMFDKYYDNLPIRKVSITLGGLANDDGIQLNLFEEYEEVVSKDKTDQVSDAIKEKFGANSLLKASSLLQDSTAITRNKKIKGHEA